MSKTSSQPGAGKRAHVRRLADGTLKTYYYDRKPDPAAAKEHYATGTLGALISAYRRSPEWAHLRPSTRTTYGIYMKVVEGLGHAKAAEIKRHYVASTPSRICLLSRVGFA